MNQSICASLSHTRYWYEVGMLKVPAYERHRYAIACPDKLGTDPMAYVGFTKYATAKIGRNPVSKHQIQHEYGDEQANAGRDCRTCLARPNSQARTGTGKY